MADTKVSGKTATTTILDADMMYIVKAADNTKGYKITGANLLLQIGSKDAYIPIQGSCTYVSATSFTISGDYTAIIGIGDKLKLTNSTVKYFVVTAVSYSAPNTTVTVTGGTTYSLTNTTITGYYSHGNPVGFPASFAWTGASGSNPQGFSSVTTDNNSFGCAGSDCKVNVDIRGTSNATTFTFTLPIAPALSSPSNLSLVVKVRDNTGARVWGQVYLSNGSTTAQVFLDANGTAFTNSGTKECMLSRFSYPI